MPTTVDFTLADAVDAIKRFHCLPDGSVVSIDGETPEYSSDMVEALYDRVEIEGNFSAPTSSRTKIPAIKFLRMTTGLGLKDSKTIIDDFPCSLVHFSNHLDHYGVNDDTIERKCLESGVTL